MPLTGMGALALLCPWHLLFAWRYEGHEVIALIAEHYMTEPAKARANELLGGGSIESVASWADDSSPRPS